MSFATSGSLLICRSQRILLSTRRHCRGRYNMRNKSLKNSCHLTHLATQLFGSVETMFDISLSLPSRCQRCSCRSETTSSYYRFGCRVTGLNACNHNKCIRCSKTCCTLQKMAYLSRSPKTCSCPLHQIPSNIIALVFAMEHLWLRA